MSAVSTADPSPADSLLRAGRNGPATSVPANFAGCASPGAPAGGSGLPPAARAPSSSLPSRQGRAGTVLTAGRPT